MTPKEIIAERAAQSVTVSAGVATTYFGLSEQMVLGLIGAAVALLSLFVQAGISIYFKRKALRIQELAAVERPECVNCPKLPEV